MTGQRLSPRALLGDAANDGYVLTTEDGVPEWAPAAGGGVTAIHTAVFYAAVVAVGTGSLKLRNLDGVARTILAVAADVVTAPSGGSVVVDVHKNGTTIFTTQANRPTITTGNTYSGKVTTIDVTNWPDGEYLTVDIDTATSPAARLQVTVVYQ